MKVNQANPTKKVRRAFHAGERHQLTTEPHVVIIGAGFGGLWAAKKLGERPVKVTVVDKHNYHLFQPMLYQVATAGLSLDDIATPIRQILRKQRNTDVLMAEVTGIDLQNQRVLMDGQSLHYDYLIVSTGASNNYFHHEDWSKYAPGLKSLDDAIKVRRIVLSAFEIAERELDQDKRDALLTFVLVGGGPTGVELAGALAELVHRTLADNFRHIRLSATRIILVEGESRLMPSFPASLTRKTQARLHQLGVEIRLGVHVKDVDENGVMIGDEWLATKNVIWTAGVKASAANRWIAAQADRNGRVKVREDLTLPDHPNIFLIGDTALVVQDGKELPELAPVAMQEGDYVASVIVDQIAGTATQTPFHYRDKGTLATVGRSFGVVNVGPLRFTGFFAWVFWIVVHIFFLIGFRNRLMVLFQYAWAYFTFQRGARIILDAEGISNR